MKEEQSAHAELFHIQANKDEGDGLGEEQASSISGRGLVQLVQKEVLVHLVKEEEDGAGHAVDDRLDDGIGEGDNGQEG